MGLTFECPVHRAGCRLAVWFANPIDGGPPEKARPGVDHLWQRTGDSFEALSLTPSIHVLSVSEWDKDNPMDRSKWKSTTHWHGFITAGEVT